MIDYNINQDKQLMQVYPNISSDKLVTAYFIPIEQIGPQGGYNYEDIGEFTHFGKLDLEDNDLNEYDNAVYENKDAEEPYDSFYDQNNFSQINESNVEDLDYSTLNNISSDSKKSIKRDRSKVKGFSTFKKYYDKVETYLPEAKKYRDLLTEIAYQESGFRSGIINRIGAAGYFQFMDSTRREILKRLKKTTNLNDFLNNPELQIVAAVQLAKSFENSFSQNDLRIAQQKGHTLNGLISGAWLGGVGGLRRYLYKGKNASDGGTTILARIKLGDQLYTHSSSNIQSNISWAKGITNDINQQKTLQLMQQLPNFNIKSSNPKYWTPKSPTASGHNCGKAVHLYIEALGLPTDGRPMYGGDYGPWLQKTGWNKISPQSQFQIGDICVTKGQGSNKEGHISMYNGRNWVSDFIQSSPLVYPWAKEGTNTFFYRYKG